MLNQANSLFVTDTEKSILVYTGCISSTGDFDDKWFCHLQIGRAYMRLNKPNDAIYWLLKGYELNPNRSETIYEITRHYRCIGENHTSHMFYNIGKDIQTPPADAKYVNKDVYKYLFDYEYSINACYISDQENVVEHCMKMINKGLPDWLLNSVYSNIKFYTKQLDKTNATTLSLTRKLGFCNSSTPCIFMWPSDKVINGVVPKYGINLRFVNYMVTSDGNYLLNGTKKDLTINQFIALDDHFNELFTTELQSKIIEERSYHGIQDIKVISCRDNLYFIGTDQHENGSLLLNFGIYDIDGKKTYGDIIPSPTNRKCEKNWAMFNTDENIKMVYGWHPIEIGSIVDGQLVISASIETPLMFKFLRGSSNGVLHNDHLWFITHCVIYETPRKYIHCIVVLNKETYKVEKYSKLFKFDGEAIEYCLGFVIDNNKFIVSYSVWDRESKIISYPLEYIESIFI